MKKQRKDALSTITLDDLAEGYKALMGHYPRWFVEGQAVEVPPRVALQEPKERVEK